MSHLQNSYSFNGTLSVEKILIPPCTQAVNPIVYTTFLLQTYANCTTLVQVYVIFSPTSAVPVHGRREKIRTKITVDVVDFDAAVLSSTRPHDLHTAIPTRDLYVHVGCWVRCNSVGDRVALSHWNCHSECMEICCHADASKD